MNKSKNANSKGPKAKKIATKKPAAKSATAVNKKTVKTGDGKDRTKYLLNGEVVGKSKLAHNIIKIFAETHPEMTTSGLQKVFPKELQGNRDVIIPAKSLKTKDQKKRSYHKKDMLISTKDGKIAVTREWGSDNFPKFLDKAKNELKFKIVKAGKKKMAA